MFRLWRLPILAIFVCAVGPAAAYAAPAVYVDEASARFSINSQPVQLSLPIHNDSGRLISLLVKAELVTPVDTVVASAESKLDARPGISIATLALPDAMNFTGPDMLWRRVKYRISQAEGSRPGESITAGVISLSQITPDYFDLELELSSHEFATASYHTRVRAFHPISSAPAPGVKLNVQLALGEDHPNVLKLSGETDNNGYAAFDFAMPEGFKGSAGTLMATGHRGVVSRLVSADLTFLRFPNAILTTDKPIYQPGQTLHIRLLMLDSLPRAMVGEAVTLKIQDPEGTGVFQADLVTSKFGVASVDWAIPPDARLGDFAIRAERGAADGREEFAVRTVEINKYELPTFSVTAKTDLGYYLPGQNASVQVRAAYLFGQPVVHAHVKVVREDNREWNYARQRWDIEEGDKHEGDADSSGLFVARINLEAAQKDFEDTQYRRFDDLHYTAYLTDLTTGRVQQQRFDIRVTKAPIHLYAQCYRGDRGPDGRIRIYFSAFYPDGRPARCRIQVGLLPPSYDDSNPEPPKPIAHLATVTTNQFGLAKIEGLRLNLPDDANGLRLVLRATDSAGLTSSQFQRLPWDDPAPVSVRVPRSLYRPGQPIIARIHSSEPGSTIVVDAVVDNQVTRSTVVNPGRNGAKVVIPYDPRFKAHLVTVSAYRATGADELANGSSQVIYPGAADLNVHVDMNRASYAPGGEAEAKLTLYSAGGRAEEGVLGVAVLDKSVEERARSGQGFGFAYQRYDEGWRDSIADRSDIAGISVSDLKKLDLSKPLPSGMDLLAEVLLRGAGWPIQRESAEDALETNGAKVFHNLLESQLNPVKWALDRIFLQREEYPKNRDAFLRLLGESGINFDTFEDPWGSRYSVDFAIQGSIQVVRINSAGPNKRSGDNDDFEALSLSYPYFQKSGRMIDLAIHEYHLRTGQFIRDKKALDSELIRAGVDPATLTDPWGNPCDFLFGVDNTHYTLIALSGGPPTPGGQKSADRKSIRMWQSWIDYFIQTRDKIQDALSAAYKDKGTFPQTDADLKTALAAAGIDLSQLLDPWGHPYYATHELITKYADSVKLEDHAAPGEQSTRRLSMIPVTQEVAIVTLWSAGPDGRSGTIDDFSAATFSQVVDERSRNEMVKLADSRAILSGDLGGLEGVVADASGAVILNATVKAITEAGPNDKREFETTTDQDGRYVFDRLPPGIYEVRFSSRGFMDLVCQAVTIVSGNVTGLDAALRAAGMTENVTISAASPMLETTNMSVVTKSGTGELPMTRSSQMSTPRLRQYFPETLLWEPELKTDSQGATSLKFKLADSLTTWKLRVIASTADGRIAATDKEFVAFQPFFVEHDPPPILTQGDQISLPVLVRNYTNTGQTVKLSIAPAPWFSIAGPSEQSVSAPSNETGRAVFDLKALSPIDNGKQRIDAISATVGDSIERTIQVHPNGREAVRSEGTILSDAATFATNVPTETIDRSLRATLKVYPNLGSHLLESVEAIVQRPYGCAEQTMSSAYPGLLVLGHYASTGEPMPPVAQRAKKYLEMAYARLINYRTPDGGFSYWGGNTADTAITAYAAAFLERASRFIKVDPDVITGAAKWIRQRQLPDGSWSLGKGPADHATAGNALLTAYITRMLAALDAEKVRTDGENNLNEGSPKVRAGLGYLSRKMDELDDPFVIASLAIAALDENNLPLAEVAVNKLRALAQSEAGTTYWALETNTPFYGWGLAGRIETTALAVRALSMMAARHQAAARKPLDAQANLSIAQPSTGSDTDSELIDRGLRFLLRNTDRYGVWYSTQATVNVLDTLMEQLSGRAKPADSSQVSSSAPDADSNETAQVFVNGKPAGSVSISRSSRIENPITLDLSHYVGPGNNRVELPRPDGGQKASAELVLSYYLPWSGQPPASNSIAQNIAHNRGLRFSISYSKSEARIGEDITCSVKIERVGFSGYGMMVAEIGLPPGGEVDQESLDKIVQEFANGVDRYEIQPDRIIFYVWPRAGGSSFEFGFRPRFAESAQTAPSCLYDYYNPEAMIVRQPASFAIH